MKHAARERALKVLGKVENEGAYAQLELKHALNGLSDEDKRFASQLVYGTLEKQLFLDYVIDSKLKKPKLPPLAREILRMGAYQLLFLDGVPPYAAISSSVDIAKAHKLAHHAGLVNAVLRAISRDGAPALPDIEADEINHYSLKYCCPRSLVELLIDQWGKNSALSYLDSMQDGTETAIRFSPSAGEAVRRELLEKASASRRGALCEDIWYVRGLGDISSLEEFKRGLVSVQSEGSRLAAGAVSASTGMKILDACAAPGGKTFAMAHDSGDGAQITAWDVHPHRVGLIESGAKRLGLHSIRAEARDATEYLPEYEQVFDAVLLDAPCSGLGVIAGKPELLLRFLPEAAESLCDLQRGLLDTCSRYVRQGGALIYSTCTILNRENEEQVAAFLERNADFCLDVNFNGGVPLLLRPDEGATEGFFIACLIRV